MEYVIDLANRLLDRAFIYLFLQLFDSNICFSEGKGSFGLHKFIMTSNRNAGISA